MKIALIGPGILSIPPKSWGAVEILIWNHKRYLEMQGHHVTIYNSTDIESVAKSINSIDYDFIHLHYDVYAEFFISHLTKRFCITSHYGWLPVRDKWSGEYRQVFAETLSAPALIALSSKIEKEYIRSGYKGFLRVLRNGVEVDAFDFSPHGNGKAVCIGNIQPRKRQALLAKLLQGRVQIDFIGPNFEGGTNVDANAIELLPNVSLDVASIDLETEFCENETSTYLGPWTKKEMYERLTEYSCLVLLSESEADPLVVKEALAAGVSLVVSEGASANLTDQPFIHVIKEKDLSSDKLVEAIQTAIRNNDIYRQKIRQYAAERFDYRVVSKEYLSIIQAFIHFHNDIGNWKVKERETTGSKKYAK